MGFQDALAKCGISYASPAAVEFADRSMEAISYYAIMASSKLAEERGTYSSYKGSKWDRGLLPIDTIALLEKERGMPVDMDRSTTMDWRVVREQVARHGMRNSNVMAIAPTATISTIIGVTQSIEPTYKHLFAKSNLSGEFIQVNINLVNELKERGLWCDELLEAIKYYDGSLGEIPGLPQDIKDRYATSFEIEPKWLIECASRRQKWIDMGQSLNLYLGESSGKKLGDMYRLAWQMGLKTTYYLRTLGATQVEKSTVDINKFGVQPRWMKNKSASGDLRVDRGGGAAEAGPSSEPPAADAAEFLATPEGQVKACRLDDPECEACQ
jgi:ribonucleoside-diphosphate reductase alpha chain